jgi:hypothetical protein
MAVSLRRVPIKGWHRCVHAAASFESAGEFKAACLLDSSASIEWWLRNDPPLVRIPTPAGNLEPDFVYRFKQGENTVMGALEVKGEVFWDGEGSIPRIKAAAACAWAEATRAGADDSRWEFSLVLEQDVLAARTFEELKQVAERHNT